MVCTCPFPSLSDPEAGDGRCGGGEVELCTVVARAREAIRLVELGARAGLVCQLTGLESAVVHRLYKQLRGRASPAGQTPFTDTWYRDDTRRMLQASVLWRLYRRLDGTGRSAAAVMIAVYESYRCLVREPLLDVIRAAFVPRLVAMGLWQARVCTHCRTVYLTPVARPAPACPGCRLYHRYRCSECGGSLPAAGGGGRGQRCAACRRRARSRRRRGGL